MREQLWREIATAYRQAAGFIDGQLDDTRLELDSDSFAIGLSTDRPERFQGHHAEHLFLVVDEASGVAESIYESAEGFLTTPGSCVLLIGNPTRPSGQCHRCFPLGARALEHGHDFGVRDAVAHGRGRPGQRLAPSRLEGMGRVGEDEVGRGIAAVGCARGRPVPSPDQRLRGSARGGRGRTGPQGRGGMAGRGRLRRCALRVDSTVIAVRRGNQIRIAGAYGSRSTMETVGRILKVARELAVETKTKPTIVVDDVGVGGGVTDRLREVGESARRRARGRRVRGAALQRRVVPRAPLDYPNRRSEVWFDFAERLPVIDLDRDEQLASDLVGPRYVIDSRGRRVVEPKATRRSGSGAAPIARTPC